MEKPQRPYANFEDYRQRTARYHVPEAVLRDTQFFPCLECQGAGKVRRYEDRCPIEGYKLAPWHKCGSCNGTGRTTKRELAERYRAAIKEWKAKLAEWQWRKKVRDKALRKLTEQERKVLGL